MPTGPGGDRSRRRPLPGVGPRTRRRKLPDQSVAGYTEVTWAEDRATRGRDPSADPGAKTGVGGRTPPLGIPGIGRKAINPITCIGRSGFAAGWGERRGANGDGGSGGEGWREWAGGVSEKSLPRRSVREAAPSLAGRRGARVSESAFQVTCPSGSRHAETRILAKEPRPATTAVGTSRQGRVAIRRLVDSSIGRFRQLAQRLREA